jgi:hypothetical protein
MQYLTKENMQIKWLQEQQKKDKRWEALIENLLPKPSTKSYDGKDYMLK